MHTPAFVPLLAAAAVATVTVAVGPGLPDAAAADDFDLSNATVPAGAIVSGGPPKDGIPALVRPRTVAATNADFLDDDELVVGFGTDTNARAYPIDLLVWHEVVNDTIDGRPLAITYCPLTASVVAYDRTFDGEEVEFGVSGLLFESNLLMYDRDSDSLWSQLGARAVAGERVGQRLQAVPATTTTWKSWRERHPLTRVATYDTGHTRAYGRDPYDGYDRSAAIYFPVSHKDSRLPAKTRVLGVVVGDTARAYPVDALRAAGLPVEDAIGSHRIVIGDTDGTVELDGRVHPATPAFWFAWASFHPRTGVWTEAAAPAPKAPANADDQGAGRVDLFDIETSWDDLSSLFLGTGGGATPFGAGSVFVVRGSLRNRSGEPIHHIVLRYELLDAGGNVVLVQEGYNRSAELIDDGRPVDPGAESDVRPIGPGARDTFRMVFFGDEVPAFESQRVSVVSVH